MKENLISVVIPNYNGLRFLPFCLNSLKNQTYGLLEVIVVDNASQDDSIRFIKEKCPQVKILVLDKNYGFAAAVNKGIKHSKGKYIALMNNDTIADKDWLAWLVKPFEKDPKIGITTSLMKLPKKKKSLIDGAGDIMATYGRPYKRGFNKKDEGQYNKSEYIFSASGGASMYRRELFGDIGYFDEDFFAYFEDVDLSFRAQLRGWKCYFVHDALIYHYHRGTSRKNKKQLFYLASRNLDIMILKNMPYKILLKFWHQHLLIFFRFCQHAIRDFYFLPQTIKGKIDFLLSLKKTIQKRKKIQSIKKIDNEELVKMFSRKLETEEEINDLTNFISLFVLCIFSIFYINIFLLIGLLLFYFIISRYRRVLVNFIRRRYYWWGKSKIAILDKISDFILGNVLLLVVLYYVFSFPGLLYVIIAYILLREVVRNFCRWSFSK